MVRFVISALLLGACAAPVPRAEPPAPTEPEVLAEWSGAGHDLHGAVVVSGPLGVPTRPDVTVDGVAIGPGLYTNWADATTPEAVAELAAADCEGLDAQLDRWSDVLYRRDVPDGDKAQADAYIGFGMERVAALGCDYEVDTEGRASPFP